MADPLSDLSKEAKQYWLDEQWGKYRNVRYETAEYERRQEAWERAIYLYVEVMIFDLQGVTSGAGGEFNQAYRGATPSVARELARGALREELDVGALEQIYGQVSHEFWVEAFPRSRTDVWEEMREVFLEHRVTVQLRRKVEELGADCLLPPEQAETFAERSDDYELLQRVETLLEEETPSDIPWKKRKRAHDYLAAVDIEHIGTRWKGKAFRWAGEVVLSNGERPEALRYFEKALEVVDEDERATVKRRINALRQRDRTET